MAESDLGCQSLDDQTFSLNKSEVNNTFTLMKPFLLNTCKNVACDVAKALLGSPAALPLLPTPAESPTPLLVLPPLWLLSAGSVLQRRPLFPHSPEEQVHSGRAAWLRESLSLSGSGSHVGPPGQLWDLPLRNSTAPCDLPPHPKCSILLSPPLLEAGHTAAATAWT